MNTYDDGYADSLSQPAYGEPQRPQKSWFGRNWLWFLPTIILAPIFCCCGGGALLIWWSIGYVLDIPAYKDSVALAQQSAEVQSALGTPIDAPDGLMDLGNVIQSGGQFEFNQVNSAIQFIGEIPITGPNGTGTLRVDASSADGGTTWTYTTQEVELPDGTVIDFLNPGKAPVTGEEETKEAAIDAAVDVIKESGRELVPDQE